MKKFFISFLITILGVVPCFALNISTGKAIRIQAVQKIDADIHKENDSVSFVVAYPVIENGKTIIPRGTEVTGTVLNSKNNFIVGVPGKIEVGNFFISNKNGEEIHLTGTVEKEGENRYWANIGWIFLFPLLFIKGDDGIIKTNTTYTLYTE